MPDREDIPYPRRNRSALRGRSTRPPRPDPPEEPVTETLDGAVAGRRRPRRCRSPTPTATTRSSSRTGAASPGWKDVTEDEWRSAQWQRSHCVKNVAQLRGVLGDLVDDRFYADLETDIAQAATMSMLVPPQMLNTMAPLRRGRRRRLADRGVLRRPGAPLHAAGALSDRRTDWTSRTRTRPATRCTSTRCGRSRASPTATPPRCSPSCCPRARSTAATAPAWTSSATPPPRSRS